MTTFSQYSTSVPAFVPSVGAVARASTRHPLTAAQLEVWLASQQSPEANCAYNEMCSLVLRGEINDAALQCAASELLRRHASLRSTFSRTGEEVRVHDECELLWRVCDWQAVSGDEARQASEALRDEQAALPFDLEHGPLVRLVWQRFSADSGELLIVAHHLVLDGWSLSVLVRDLGQLYDRANGREVTLEQPGDFRDYATNWIAYEQSAEGQADREYWRNQYALPQPPADLPGSGRRPPLRTYAAARYDHWLPASLVVRARRLGSRSQCSLFNTILAVFQAYLARLTDCNDIAVAVPTAGQSAFDYPHLIGHCVNTLPIRQQIDWQDSWSQHLKKSRTQFWGALEHQRFSFGSLLNQLPGGRDPARPPLCAVSFNLDPQIDLSQVGFEGLAVQLRVEPRRFENFEWFVNGIIHPDQSIELQIQYNTQLFTHADLEWYFRGFEAFLAAWLEQPELPLNRLPLLSREQLRIVRQDWNSTERHYSSDASWLAEFVRLAHQNPQALAVTFQNRQLTYGELQRQSNQVARYLQQQGIAAGDLVGICCDRSERLLVNLLGILKVGAGYVPLDPHYPAERLQGMCHDAGLRWVVTETIWRSTVAAWGVTPLDLLEQQEFIGQLSAADWEYPLALDQVMYVIFTSGSTGRPKGVCVPHGCVLNFLHTLRETLSFQATERALALTTLSFDIAVLEMYLPLFSGGQVVVVERAVASDGPRLAALLRDQNISWLQATPATWRLLLQSGWAGNPGLKGLIGGEALPVDLWGRLRELVGELWNMYGPTETTVWSTAQQMSAADQRILIGRPLGNTQVYVWDQFGHDVPPGREGELLIGGAGVTSGYLNRPELTAERFIDNPFYSPFSPVVNHRLYRTGDIVKFTDQGALEYIRRNDKQIKLRGFRIELGEIEAALVSSSEIAQAVVIVREDQPGDQRLVAYAVPASPAESPAEFSWDAVREHLQSRLPAYMVPQHFVVLSEFPLTQNGKVDQRALPAPIRDVGVPATLTIEPLTAAEQFLASIWQEILQVPHVSRDDNFFAVGGHSLLVMQVIHRVEQQTGVRLAPPDFLWGTLQQLAQPLTIALTDRQTQVPESHSAEHAAATPQHLSPKPQDTEFLELEASPSGEDNESADSAAGGLPNGSNPAAVRRLFDRLKNFWN